MVACKCRYGQGRTEHHFLLFLDALSHFFRTFTPETINQILSTMIQQLSQLKESLKGKPLKRIAVAAAEDLHVLTALKQAVSDNIVAPVLVGNQDKIEALAKDIGLPLDKVELIDNKEGAAQSAHLAARLIQEGRADVLMKGAVGTADLLRAVLDKENGLRTASLLSHVAFFQSPYYHKLICVTDVAMNIAPDLAAKVDILNNAVEACHRIGIAHPKVAAIAAVEVVNPKMQATLDAAALKEMNQKGEITGCTVDGPLAIDLAVNKEAARIKNIGGDVAGDADIILAPAIEAGNMFYKALNFLGGAQSAAVIMGAKVPIVLTSRSDDEQTKYYSIALAAAMG